MALAHMQSHDLARLRIYSKKAYIVDNLYRLRIGIELPFIRQNMFNNERDRRGSHILKQVFLLCNRYLIAQQYGITKSLFDMIRGVHTLKVADRDVIL